MDTKRRLTEALIPIGVLCGLCGIYRVWALPLPVADFSGFFQVVEGSQSTSHAFRSLTWSLFGEGRYFPLTTWRLAAEWRLFGAWALGWHVVQAFLVGAVLLLTYVRLRRMSISARSAALAIVCAIVMGAVGSALTLPQTCEPIGLIFFLIALFAADLVLDGRRNIAALIVVALSTTAAILAKETFVVVIPAVLIVAARCAWPGPAALRRLALLVAVLAVTVGSFAAAPAAYVRAHAREQAYVERYSVRQLSPARVINTVSAMTLPVTRNVLFPANVAYLLIVGAGIAAFALGGDRNRHAALEVAALATVPLLATLVYLPWPGVRGYDALIGFVFQAAAIAFALDAAAKHVRLRFVAPALTAVFVGCGLIIALNGAAVLHADRRLEQRMTQALRDGADQGVTLITSSASSYADALAGYAQLGMGRADRISLDGCGSLANADPRRAVLVLPESGCDLTAVSGRTTEIRECAVVVDWKTFARRDQCRSAVWITRS